VPRVNERRRPPTAHDGVCRDVESERVAQHLRDGQGGRYFWARDLEVARQVFRARALLQPTRRSRSVAPPNRTRSSVIRVGRRSCIPRRRAFCTQHGGSRIARGNRSHK
jgi:hypothetical protein